MTTRTIAIIGASLAGAKAAAAARDAGHDGPIRLIGAEASAPYERPALSKQVLRGEADAASTLVHPPGFYDEHGIEFVADKATRLDTTGRVIELSSGATVSFDSVILATGAAPRRLDVPGGDLGGVHALRTIDDAVQLRSSIRAGGRVAVVGAGWIGSEVAASARQMGAEVLLIDPADVPLRRTLGPVIGEVFRGLHAEHGVDLRLGTGVAELRGKQTVEAIVLDDGTVEAVDTVVVGIGVTPCTQLATVTSGLRVDDGIVVDAYLETDVPGVYAAGDVANAWHPHYGRHLRVEHWANALNQGITAGGNAAGRRDSYDRLPYFFSDQYDLGMEYVGHSARGDTITIRGHLDAREFIAFWHHDGLVTAAMHVNVWDVTDDLKALINAHTRVDPRRLADPAIPVDGLVGASHA